MKFLMSSLLIVFSINNVLAFDINDYVKRMKSQARDLLNSGEKVDAPDSKWEMPVIPKVKQNATSTEVYNKSGRLYEQGESFKKLSVEDKRRYRIAFIREIYNVTKNEQITDDKVISHLNMLEQGGSREGIYRSIVLGQDYLMLESMDNKSSDKLVDFSVDYGQRYLARKFSNESIKKINLWGVKRIIVEKTLDVMDSFSKDGKDLYVWYGILSADLAENFKSAFESKARQNTSIDFHHRWVQSVPYQQIKSEVIVKLHKVMNSLQ